MIEHFLNNLDKWVNANPFIGLLTVFFWGIFSVVFSPCHLASIPLIIGFVGSSIDITKGRAQAFRFSAVFCTALFLAVFSLGIITASLGRLMGDVGYIVPIIAGVILIVLGIYLLDILPFELPSMSGQVTSRKGYLGATVFGLSYGVVSGPCTFAFVAPVLAVITVQKEFVYGVFLMLSFTLGHVLPLLLAGTSSGWVEAWLSHKHFNRATRVFRKASGVLIVLVGLYFLINTLRSVVG